MKSFKQFNEVAPPGFGHTKGDKEKGVKKGGTAAAFDRARKRGDFKGSKSDMFAIMWSQKNKGDKPHYKPGTDKKYKKYQDVDEAVKGQDTESRKEGAKERTTEKRAHDTWKKSGVGKTKRPLYSTTKHTKNVGDSYATQEKQSIDWHDKKTKGKFIPGTTSESLGFTIDSGEHKKASKKAKMRNLAKGNTNPNEKAAAEKKAGGPKLIGETLSAKDTKKLQKASVLATSDNPKDQDRARARQTEIDYKDLMRQIKNRNKKKVNEETSCGEGEYFCNDEQKCKPIPKGHHVMPDGKLMKGEKHSVKEEKKNCGCGKDPCITYGKEKKKAIDTIPNKSSEVYNKNWQHKTPDNTRESVEIHDANGNLAAEIIDIIKPEPMRVPDSPVKWKELTELTKLPNYNKTGNIIDVYLAWRGKNYMIQTFFPQVSKPSRKEVIDQIQKIYPNCRVWNYQISTYNPGEPVLQIN